MKLVKGYALISQTELDEAIKDAEKRGVEKGGKESKTRIESLEKGLEKKDKQIEKLNDDYEASKDKSIREVERLEAKIEVLEEERDDVREVVKQSIENEDLAATLGAKKDGLDKQIAALKDRESKLESKEEGRYKEGYADGVADGVRKINEITQKDRDNAMKVAMVSAASHTDPRIVAEINNVKSLTEGTTDSEDE